MKEKNGTLFSSKCSLTIHMYKMYSCMYKLQYVYTQAHHMVCKYSQTCVKGPHNLAFQQ